MGWIEEYVQREVEIDRVYERWGELQPGMIVLDVGAHQGFFTRWALDKIGPDGYVIAFEPEEHNFRILVNSLSTENALCKQVAIWDSDKEIELFVSGNNSGAHSAARQPASVTHKQKVQAAKLDTLMDEGLITGCDFLKIDTEEAERRVLMGAVGMIERFQPHIVMEVHGDQKYREIWAIANKIGYTVIPDRYPGDGICCMKPIEQPKAA